MHIPPEYHEFYRYLTLHIVPGPQSFSYFLTLLILPIALLVPRSVLSRWQSILLFMPIITASTIHSWTQIGCVDVISVDVWLKALGLIALADPWKDFKWLARRRGDTNGNATGPTVPVADTSTGSPTKTDDHDATAQTILLEPSRSVGTYTTTTSMLSYKDVIEQPYPSELWPRLVWVGTLLSSIRLSNWKTNLPSHDRSQPLPPGFASRKSFALYAITCFVRGYLTLDVTRAYISYDPYFTDLTVSISSPLPFEGLRPIVPAQLLRSVVLGAQVWALIGQLFYISCLVPVAANYYGWLAIEWSPHYWSPFFGNPRSIFTHGVRGLWGEYWHQTMRISVSAPGFALSKAMGLKRNSLAKYTLLCVIAFGLSGAIHTGLVPPEPLHATIHPNTIRLYVAGFFWIQPVAMLLELIVARSVARTSDPQYWQQGTGLKLRIVVNGLWAVAWFAITLPMLGEASRQLGYWRVWPLPVSLCRGLMGERWVTWPILLKNNR